MRQALLSYSSGSLCWNCAVRRSPLPWCATKIEGSETTGLPKRVSKQALARQERFDPVRVSAVLPYTQACAKRLPQSRSGPSIRPVRMTLLASSRPSRTAHSQRIAEHLEAYPARPELSKALRLCAHQRLIIVFSASPTRGRIDRITHGCRDICDSRAAKG